MVIGRPRLVFLRGPFWVSPDVLSTLLRRCRTPAALGAMRRVIPGPHTAVWRYMLRAGTPAGRRIIASHAGQGHDATGPQPILDPAACGGTTCGRLNILLELYFDENDLMGLPIPEWFDST